MGVRIYTTGFYLKGAHCGIIGPDEDGNIKLPSVRSNLFIREGSCGSAPLYHQERKPEYLYACGENVTCNWEYQSDSLLTIARDTWCMVARYRSGRCECQYYYSSGGRQFMQKKYCVGSSECGQFIRALNDKDNPIEPRVKQCWTLCGEDAILIDGWNSGVWPFNRKIVDAEVTPIRGTLSHKYLDFWELATETGVVFPPSDLQLCLSKASEDLAASLPQTPINIAEALIDLVSVKNISNAFRTSEKVSAMLADSWLKWRYVYTTTKLDVRSIREFLNRGLSLFEGTTKKDYSCHGYAHLGDLTCRCSTSLQGRELKEQFRRASQSLHLYDLWDLVPWSFMVDWFIPIGSMLQNLEYQNNLLKLDHGTIWYTCEWYEDSASENFMRFCTNHFVTTPCSISYSKGPTNKTIAMRCIDAMALLIGR